MVARKLLGTRILTCASRAHVKRHGRPEHPRDPMAATSAANFAIHAPAQPFDWEFHKGRSRIVMNVKGPCT